MQTLCALPESQSETVAGWRGCLVRDAGPDGFANPLFGSPGVLEETTASNTPGHAGHARPARPRHNRRSACAGHSETFGTSPGSSLRVFCTLRCAPGDHYCQRFGYDNEDRLTSFHRQNGDSQTWNLSLVGDWNQFNANGTIQNRTHNAVHELIKVNNEALLYDAKGNLTENDNEQRYEWDIESRLTVAVLKDDKPRDRAIILGEYAYDALGRRVSKRVGDVETIFINDGLQEIAEYEKTGKKSVLEKAFVFGSYIDEPLVMVSGKDKFYYHPNNLYSITALTNQVGATVERYTYDPYGKVKILAPNGVRVLAVSSVGNPWTFQGRYLDTETGLMQYRTRYYDPNLGRFINRMPWHAMGGKVNFVSYLPYLPVKDNKYWYRKLKSCLRRAEGSYLQRRYNLYDFEFTQPTNYVEPFSDGERAPENDPNAEGGEDYEESFWEAIGNAISRWLSDETEEQPVTVSQPSAPESQSSCPSQPQQPTPPDNPLVYPPGFIGPLPTGAVRAGEEEQTVPASTPTGRSGSPMQPVTTGGESVNSPTTIAGTNYSGHAIDSMQADGIPPSAVQHAIDNGEMVTGKVPGTSAYYDSLMNLTVITNSESGMVVTVSLGQIKQ